MCTVHSVHFLAFKISPALLTFSITWFCVRAYALLHILQAIFHPSYLTRKYLVHGSNDARPQVWVIIEYLHHLFDYRFLLFR